MCIFLTYFWLWFLHNYSCLCIVNIWYNFINPKLSKCFSSLWKITKKSHTCRLWGREFAGVTFFINKQVLISWTNISREPILCGVHFEDTQMYKKGIPPLVNGPPEAMTDMWRAGHSDLFSPSCHRRVQLGCHGSKEGGTLPSECWLHWGGSCLSQVSKGWVGVCHVELERARACRWRKQEGWEESLESR